MSRLVLLHPSGLVAQELLEALKDHPLGRDVQLLSLDEDEVGQLTEAAGAAALVGRADAAALSAADAIVVLGSVAPYRELLAEARGDATVVLATTDATPEDGPAVVAGVNPDAARPGGVLVSPDPGAILLAHLLSPLLGEGEEGGGGGGGTPSRTTVSRLRRAVATLVRPVSTFDRPGLDELFSQAGRMVSMQSQAPSALFGDRQLAFNLFPAPEPPRHLAAQLGSVLGTPASGGPQVTAHVLQGAVFHGYSALVHVELEGVGDGDGGGGDDGGGDDGGGEAVAARLAASPWIEPLSADAGAPAPIDVAGADGILLAAVHPDEGGTGYWLWAVMDNLTRGGALNVLEILETVLPADA